MNVVPSAGRVWFASAALWLLSFPSIAVPFTSIPYQPEADTFGAFSYPGANFGALGALAVAGSAAANTSGPMDTFIRFNTQTLVADLDSHFQTHAWVIQSVVLRLHEQTRPTGSFYNRGQGHFEVRWIAQDSWPEGTGAALPSKSPPTPGHLNYTDESSYLTPGTDASLGTFPNYGPNAPNDFYDLFCTLALPDAFVQDIRAGGEVSFFLTAADPNIGLQFGSRTNGDVNTLGYHPWIQVTADLGAEAPEPATACLLAFGLAALARARRRRP